MRSGEGGREGSGDREGSGGRGGSKNSDSDVQKVRETARERECQKRGGKGYDGSSSDDECGGVVIISCD
jgi:hypothetical protein